MPNVFGELCGNICSSKLATRTGLARERRLLHRFQEAAPPLQRQPPRCIEKLLADRRLDLLQADLVVQAVLGAAVLTEALGNEVVARSDEAHATRCLALGDLQTAKLKADAEHRRRSAQNRLPVDASN